MFELQNNRGKDLTNLEKLKSFLMYQLYVFSTPDETEGNINYVSSLFILAIYLSNSNVKTIDEFKNKALKMFNEMKILQTIIRHIMNVDKNYRI